MNLLHYINSITSATWSHQYLPCRASAQGKSCQTTSKALQASRVTRCRFCLFILASFWASVTISAALMEEELFVKPRWNLDCSRQSVASVRFNRTFSRTFPMIERTVIPLCFVGNRASLSFFKNWDYNSLFHILWNVTSLQDVIHKILQ